MKFKEFYKLFLENDELEELEPIYISGEYWFDDRGDTMYADGDVGDMNHEMYVEQRVTSTILNYFDLELNEWNYFNLSDYFDEIKTILLKKIDADDESLEKFEEDFWHDPKQMIEDYIVLEFNEPREKISKMLYMRDAREYAIEEWGWSRVHGKHIEVNRLTNEQLKIVSSGIWNALDEEGKIYEDEERIAAGQAKYYISTYTGKRYEIKLDDMDSPENISGLEESPIQHQPSFANIDKLDKQDVSDFYKDKPFGDSVDYQSSYKFKKFYSESTEDTETPVEKVSRLFKELADDQRFKGPEDMFQSDTNPGVELSSIFQWAAEHTGDLIHRASYPPRGTVMGGPIGYGYAAVREKTKKLLKLAREWKDYSRQTRKNPFIESLRNDYDYEVRENRTSESFEEYEKRFKSAAKRYSDSYKNLKAYTELQRLSRGAAVSLGNLNIDFYTSYLTNIIYLMDELGEAAYLVPSKNYMSQDINISELLNPIKDYVQKQGLDNIPNTL